MVKKFCLIWFGLLSAAYAAESVSLTGRAMGTTWSARFLQPAPPLAPAAVSKKISARLEALEQQFSTYRPTSELSRFNATTSTGWFPVSPELAEVATASRRISEFTAGAFDPTLAPLLRLWGFGPQPRADTSLPTASEIDTALAFVDWHRLESRPSPPALRKTNAALAADFSSVAKGFSADALSELLVSLGAPEHFIQIGGDIRTRGHAADGAAWRAGIEEPREHAATLAAVVALSGHALSTSGNYRNVVTLAGRRYGHILDPRTGRPVANTLAAVSVIASTCAESSALATALFVLGEDAGLALATREKIAAVFFVRTGETFTQRHTPAFEALRRPK
ncbi:MAG: FAD:protein FMN transferase [Verrucomicrobia bacterium]|nr:FAD:protein FMN transferase [Verrucomicrobiota bacterium]